MLHIATAHLGPRWVDVQLGYLRRHLTEPYQVWASVERVPEAVAAKFHHAHEMRGDHAGKLNLLWYLIDQVADNDDLVVFCDSDTLPIQDPVPFIREALEDVALVAVKRIEDDGDPQPHPLFCATTARRWREIGCDWSMGHMWRARSGGLTSDVGSNLLYRLESKDLPWLPLYRVNAVDLHPVWFGVYGGLVYHHGAGSRNYPLSRPEIAKFDFHYASIPLLRDLKNIPRAYRRRRRVQYNRHISREVYEQLAVDPEFWHRFMPLDESGGAVARRPDLRALDTSPKPH